MLPHASRAPLNSLSTACASLGLLLLRPSGGLFEAHSARLSAHKGGACFASRAALAALANAPAQILRRALRAPASFASLSWPVAVRPAAYKRCGPRLTLTSARRSLRSLGYVRLPPQDGPRFGLASLRITFYWLCF